MITDFTKWFKDRGFKPRLKLTGRRGDQVILDIKVDSLGTVKNK